jgi:bacterioferritin
MRELDQKKAIELLNSIMEFELAGVVRYTHYSLMVTGPNRIPIVEFFKLQATESLTHAQQVGEILTGLDGHPSLKITPMEESYKHTVRDILEESLSHEKKALDLYKRLLDTVDNASIYLEEFARTMIGTEELHNIEIKKMLRDYSGSAV